MTPHLTIWHWSPRGIAVDLAFAAAVVGFACFVAAIRTSLATLHDGAGEGSDTQRDFTHAQLNIPEAKSDHV